MCGRRGSRRFHFSCGRASTGFRRTHVMALLLTKARCLRAAQDILAALRTRGASFFADLTRATGLLASRSGRRALGTGCGWHCETADGFENLRALIDPRRRRGQGREGAAKPRHSGGRWAIMRQSERHVSASERAEAFVDQLDSAVGRIDSRPSDEGDHGAVLARPASDSSAQRGPGRTTRRQIRRGIFGRAVRRAGGGGVIAIGAAFAGSVPEDLIQIANADPLNLAGILLPGPRVSTLSHGSSPDESTRKSGRF